MYLHIYIYIYIYVHMHMKLIVYAIKMRLNELINLKINKKNMYVCKV